MKPSPTLAADLVDFVATRAGRVRITITGKSMEPALRVGMVIDVEPLRRRPRVGDILVFKSQSGLIAHRLVGRQRAPAPPTSIDASRRTGFITCGDANPGSPEFVPASLVIGRVTAVWASGAAQAARLDDRRFGLWGALIARGRRGRSAFAKARAFAADVGGYLRHPAPAAFAALLAATQRFERGAKAEAVAVLASVAPSAIVDIARRHHVSGLLSCWLDDAARSGVAVNPDLEAALRRIRWSNALQACRILACVRDVRDRFTRAEIPHIFLKGGARLAAGTRGADVQFCGDVDVIVPTDLAERAIATLRAGGYRDVVSGNRPICYAVHHHREPLCSPDVDVPVEVHVALAPPHSVRQHLDFAALAPARRLVDGPIGQICVLDDVAAAVHLAYHARDFHCWRDIVLLSRLLRGFDGKMRARFEAIVAGEDRDGVRLRSAVRAADLLAGHRTDLAANERRYIRWATVREDLPRRFREFAVIDALIGRGPLDGASARGRGTAGVARDALHLIALFPVLARAAQMRRPSVGPAHDPRHRGRFRT